ncbi:hypothetical protein SCUCBS95973_003242 [Sporothrix curviconia]|uniref:Uncharacterized protein n=1 Tax=Sporothrix curviconia TaxID=1260050 RepID=A0ABP0BE12_9PEZI
MAATAAPSPAIVGRRLLGEIEETSLEDTAGPHPGRPAISGSAAAVSPVKNAAAATATATATPALRLPSFPIPALQQLVARHFRSTRAPELVAGGQRPLALAYLLVATLVAAPLRQTVVVVDAEARFDARQLLGVQPRASAVNGSGTGTEGNDRASHTLSSAPVTEDDLQHVHVFRVDPRWRVPLAEMVAAAEQRVLYSGQRRRRDRPWWGTIVVGGGASGGGARSTTSTSTSTSTTALLGHGVGAALVTGPYGWLRVDRQERDAVEVYQERQRQLLALLEGVDLDHNSDDDDQAGAGDKGKASGVEAFEQIIWVAGSPWGSFTFQLSKPALAEVQGNEGV